MDEQNEESQQSMSGTSTATGRSGMSLQAHTVEVSCGYCLRQVADMENPKTLICGHVCCELCLENDTRLLNGDIECPVCR